MSYRNLHVISFLCTFLFNIQMGVIVSVVPELLLTIQTEVPYLLLFVAWIEILNFV